MRSLKRLLALPFLLWGLAACGDGNGQLSVSLTDAATDEYKAVYVTIAEVQVHKSGADEDDDSDGSWITVATPNKTYDLLEVTGGVREGLGIATLATGHYTQMRLIVGTTPSEGIDLHSKSFRFANYAIGLDDAVHELKIPSGEQTGVKIVGGFDVNENETTEIVLDFDASTSIVVQGNGQHLLKPTIKILETHDDTIVSGTVTDGDDNPIAGATVSAQLRDGMGTVQTETTADENGHYKLFVRPGTYNLVATNSDHEHDEVVFVAAAGETQTEDFSLSTAATGTLGGTALIPEATSDTFVTLSVRQEVDIDGDTQIIEVAREDIATGGDYELTLPEGDYTAVFSTYGFDAQSVPVTIAGGESTPLDLTLSLPTL